jgi:hypothetical protein
MRREDYVHEINIHMNGLATYFGCRGELSEKEMQDNPLLK